MTSATGRGPVIVVLATLLGAVVVLLALFPFHLTARFAAGSGRATGACPAPIVSAVRRTGDGLGLWTATIRGQRLFYFPVASKPPVQPPGGATIAVPLAPCHDAARVRIVAAAVALVAVSLLPSAVSSARRGSRARSAMMAP